MGNHSILSRTDLSCCTKGLSDLRVLGPLCFIVLLVKRDEYIPTREPTCCHDCLTGELCINVLYKLTACPLLFACLLVA
jgi:hypothetical protein